MQNQKQNGQKRLKSFLVLWSGQAVSLLGSQLVQFALIWWLTQTTGSATVLATASLMGLLPQVVLGPFAGVLVDRWNRRLTLLLADSLVAIAAAGLALLFWLGVAQPWHVFAILFVRALAGAFHWPAMSASTSLMVPEAHLTRIQGLNQMLNGGLNIISAPLGALLVSLLPLQGILAIDVVTALFAIVPLFFIAIPQPPRLAATAVGADTALQPTFWDDMRAGLAYIRNWSGLLVLMGMAMAINFILHPTISLMPLLITQHFNGTAYHLGALETALGIGILIGSVILSTWGGFQRRILTSMLALIGLGLGFFMVGGAPAVLFSLAVVGMFLSGLMNPMVNGPIFAIIQGVVAPEMQGRVFTLLGSLASGMAPLGLLLAGPLADRLSVRYWFMISGGLIIVLGMAGFFIPALLAIEMVNQPMAEPVSG